MYEVYDSLKTTTILIPVSKLISNIIKHTDIKHIKTNF